MELFREIPIPITDLSNLLSNWMTRASKLWEGSDSIAGELRGAHSDDRQGANHVDSDKARR